SRNVSSANRCCWLEGSGIILASQPLLTSVQPMKDAVRKPFLWGCGRNESLRELSIHRRQKRETNNCHPELSRGAAAGFRAFPSPAAHHVAALPRRGTGLDRKIERATSARGPPGSGSRRTPTSRYTDDEFDPPIVSG